MEALRDEALVIRGGLMQIPQLRIALDTCHARHGFYGLSFFGENGLTVEQLADLADLPNLQIRVSTVGRLRKLGHRPYRSGQYPHLTIRFGVSPSDEECKELADAFDLDIPNPSLVR